MFKWYEKHPEARSLRDELVTLDKQITSLKSKNIDKLIKADANTIINQTKQMSYNDILELNKKLPPEKRLEIAKLNAKNKPNNMSIQQFADSDDLLFVREGEFNTYNYDLEIIRKEQPIKQHELRYDYSMSTEEAFAAADNSDDMYIKKLSTFVSDTALDELAIKYKDEYIKIVSENETLLNKAKNYSNLSQAEQQNMAQEIINKIAKKQGVEAPKVSFEYDLKDMGSYNKKTKTIKINPKDHYNFAKLMNSLSHEYMHHIDIYKPELGGLGPQLAPIGEQMYSTRNTVYKLNPTETSSHKIGDFIEDSFKKLLNIP